MAGKNGNDTKLIEILGIDTGFSSVKVADDEGKTFRFPNHVVEHDPDLLDIGFGQSKDVVNEIASRANLWSQWREFQPPKPFRPVPTYAGRADSHDQSVE